MRALALEHTDREVAKAAYRELITLHADHPLHHPETVHGVARARAAVERLTPTLSSVVNRAEIGSAPTDIERLA